MTVGERVKLIRKHKKCTLESFGERLGVTKAALSRIEHGASGLTDQMCKSICREFGVSEDWLRNEIGEPFIESVNDTAAVFARENNLGQTEEVLIREFLNLTESEKETFRKYLRNVMSELSSSDQDDEDCDNYLLPFA